MIKTGLTKLIENKFEQISGKRTGLITNPTGVDNELKSNISIFARSRDVQLKALFSPEHGLWASAQDAIEIPNSFHEVINVPIYSLYGSSKKPDFEMLKDLDILVFDIQDVGARFYTYITTMAYAMESCAKYGVKFIVLDRPNPINGIAIEGNILEDKFRSFVGYYPIPIRHGMTVGELALMFNEEIKADLDVVSMEGWKRDMWYDDTGLQWVMPSPNMPTLNTAIVYPGTCLFEGTNVSEGRGTTKPFEIIGAPWIDPLLLTDNLNQLSLPGVIFRPLYFVPTFSKYKGLTCGGVQIHVTDRNIYRPVMTALYMLETMIRMYPMEFNWVTSNGGYFFDFLCGTDKIRKHLLAKSSIHELTALFEIDLLEFDKRRRNFLIY